MLSAVVTDFRPDNSIEQDLLNSDFQELAVISSVQGGQIEEFVQLYDRYVEKIYKFLYYRTGHREQAEDLTSLVFMQALQKIHMFNGERGTFQAWLYRIARNLMIDEFRKVRPSENLDDHYDLASSENIEIEVDKEITAKSVNDFLASMPSEDRDLIRMRLWDDLSYRDIAEITGKTEGSLKMQFSRLVKKMQDMAPFVALLLLIIQS